MLGRYNGLQAHLKRRNPLIHYIPCAAHSLNWVGVKSVHSSPEVKQYFSLLYSLYLFCSASTHRWGTVFAKTNLTFKRLCNTQWYNQYSGWFGQISLEKLQYYKRGLKQYSWKCDRKKGNVQRSIRTVCNNGQTRNCIYGAVLEY